jgi:hypothetical protein
MLSLPLGLGLPIDSLFSTQGIMVLLLVGYAGAMWMFLSTFFLHSVILVISLNSMLLLNAHYSVIQLFMCLLYFVLF